MRRKIQVFTMFVRCVILGILACASEIPEIQQTRQVAIKKIDAISAKAPFHHGALDKIRNLVPMADYNIDLIVKSAEYISKVPYETLTLTRIAVIAAKMNHECPLLNDVLELPIIQAGGSDDIIRAAKSCTQIKNETDKMTVKNEIERLRNQAKFKNVAEALAAIE